MLLLALWWGSEAEPAAPSALVTRQTAATQVYEVAMARYQTGGIPVEEVYTWSKRWYEAQKALGDGAAGRNHAERMKSLAALVHQRVQSGQSAPFEEAATAWYVADAEILAGG